MVRPVQVEAVLDRAVHLPVNGAIPLGAIASYVQVCRVHLLDVVLRTRRPLVVATVAIVFTVLLGGRRLG